jgi:hypothetical protein
MLTFKANLLFQEKCFQVGGPSEATQTWRLQMVNPPGLDSVLIASILIFQVCVYSSVCMSYVVSIKFRILKIQHFKYSCQKFNIYFLLSPYGFPFLKTKDQHVYHPIPRLTQNGSRILISDPKLLS